MDRVKAERIEKEIIAQMQTLSAVYIKWGENSSDEETGFIIKDEDRYIDQIPKMPMIGMRSALLKVGDVWPVIVIIFICNTFYEVWFNYHQIGGGEEYFQDLARQELIMLHIYNQNGERRRNIRVGNGLKEGFSQYLEILKNTTPWPMEAFDQAKEELYRMYPTPKVFWTALGEASKDITGQTMEK